MMLFILLLRLGEIWAQETRQNVTIGFAYVGSSSLNETSILIGLKKKIIKATKVGCPETSYQLTNPVMPPRSQIVRTSITKDSACQDDLAQLSVTLQEIARNDGNVVNVYIRDTLKVRAPYLAVVDELMIGMDPFMLNVVVISASLFAVAALSVTACALSKAREHVVQPSETVYQNETFQNGGSSNADIINANMSLVDKKQPVDQV